jgi:hypothetical protein
MVKRTIVLAAGAAGLLMTTALPASAQFADFFCDTFTIGCRPPPPPPPPVLAPAVEEPVAPPKKVHKAHKPKPKKKAAAETDAAPAAPDAAAK